MSILYDVASETGPLRQGDVIGPLWEHRAVYPPSTIRLGKSVGVRSIAHALVVVLSPDCDLIWDYEMRFDSEPDAADLEVATEDHSSAVTHVLLCDLYSYEEIRPRFKGKPDVWDRVRRNQDERYHHLDSSRVGEGGELVVNDLYLDFKRVFSLPTDRIYEGVLSQEVERTAVLREVYTHDLIHRFYGFLSRIAVAE